MPKIISYEEFIEVDSKNDFYFRKIIEFMKDGNYDSKEITAIRGIYESYKMMNKARLCFGPALSKITDILESFLTQENGDVNKLLISIQSIFDDVNKTSRHHTYLGGRKPRRVLSANSKPNYSSSANGLAVSAAGGTQMVGGISFHNRDRRYESRIATDGYKAVQKDVVNFSCYYDKVASTSSTVCLNFAAYEEEFKRELDDMFENQQHPKSSGKKLIEKNIEYDVILTSPDLKRFRSEQKFTWLGEYSVLYFIAKIPEDYDKEKVIFRFNVKNTDIVIASIIVTVDVKNNTANISDTINPHVFLSYSSEDYDKVRISKVVMESLGLCKDLFFDRDHLKQGQIWYKEAEEAIDDCDIFFLFWSNDAMESKNVKREYEYMIKKRGLDKLKLVPINKMNIDKIPAQLKDIHYDNKLAAEIERLYTIKSKSKNIL